MQAARMLLADEGVTTVRVARDRVWLDLQLGSASSGAHPS